MILPFQDQIAETLAARADNQPRAESWILQDPLRGKFLVDPIDGPYQDVKFRLDEIKKYFTHPNDKAASQAETDLSKASIMPPTAYKVLIDYVNKALNGTFQAGGQPGQAADQGVLAELADYGLIAELENLRERHPDLQQSRPRRRQ